MDISDFGRLFSDFARSAFRLETLTRYSVAEETEALDLYLGGEFLPTRPNAEWVRIVENAVGNGKSMSRVHIVPKGLSPYLRFEIEWAYLYSAGAGEQIYLLFADAVPDVASLHDFWLFDDKVVVEMIYDASGRFVGVNRRPDSDISDYIALRDRLCRDALPLRQYLSEVRNSEAAR